MNWETWGITSSAEQCYHSRGTKIPKRRNFQLILILHYRLNRLFDRMKMVVVEIKDDFEKTLNDYSVDQIEGYGYQYLPSNSTVDNVSKAIYTTMRHVDPRPRELSLSKERDSDFQREDVEKLLINIRRGVDLNPHLSKRISNLNKLDNLHMDWGIYHLHLGDHIEDKNGFIHRTGDLLFSMFDEKYAYVLGVFPHNAWAEEELLQIIDRNWPHLLSRLEGPLIPQDERYTEDEINALREAGIMALVPDKNGKPIMPPGGGITTNGTSARAKLDSIKIVKGIREFERSLKQEPLKYLEQKSGFNLSELEAHEKLTFELHVNHIDGILLAVPEIDYIESVFCFLNYWERGAEAALNSL